MTQSLFASLGWSPKPKKMGLLSLLSTLYMCKAWTKLKDIDIHEHYTKHLVYSFVCDIVPRLLLWHLRRSLCRRCISSPLLSLPSSAPVAMRLLAPSCTLPLMLSSRTLIRHAASTRQWLWLWCWVGWVVLIPVVSCGSLKWRKRLSLVCADWSRT